MGGYFDIDSLKKKIDDIEKSLNDRNNWSNRAILKQLSQEKSDLSGKIEQYNKLNEDLDSIGEFIKLNDDDLISDIKQLAQSIEKNLHLAEKIVKFSDPSDKLGAIVTVHPGAGGTEACDWADMLFRMYLGWAEQKGYKIEIVNKEAGAEAGIKSAMFIIKGLYVYGRLKSENGVHRLVRVSPFDSAKRRHTSFASIIVIPEADDNIEIEIDKKDLRIDTYRSSGAGGQHVNKTDSAIRITHIPTRIVVTCQNERSQFKNKATAMKILKSKLYELERKEKKKKEDGLSEKKANEWGSQLRSYILFPYKMVKDHRNGVISHNPDLVLSGDIDRFL